MEMLLGLTAALGLLAGLASPAQAQLARCSSAPLSVDGTAVSARFCVPAEAAGSSVTVTETFSAAGKTIAKSIAFPVNPAARTSRTADEIDLAPLGLKRSVHMTLMYRAGSVELEHALELPGAIPLK